MELLAVGLCITVLAFVIQQARRAHKHPKRMSPEQEAREEEWFNAIR